MRQNHNQGNHQHRVISISHLGQPYICISALFILTLQRNKNSPALFEGTYIIKSGEIILPSFLQNHYKVTLHQYEFIRGITKGYSERTYQLFCHILVCNIGKLATRADNLFIPIAWKLIDRRLKRANWKELDQRRLIEVRPYHKAQGLSREFKVVDWVLSEFLRLGDLPAAEYVEHLVNLFTGRPSKKIARSRINDFNRHPLPPVIRDAMRVFEKNLCPFNCTAVERYLAEAQAAIDQYEVGTAQYKREEARYRANKSCWTAVLNQMQSPLKDGINYYSPAYDCSKSGRIHQIGGALQSCSRVMKSHAYSGIDNLFNYDLQASQINVLIQFFEDAGLDASWLITYRDTPNNKAVYAKKAGLPTDVWKTCLLSLVMGAYLPPKIRDHKASDNSIVKKLAELVEEDEDKLKELLAGFSEVVMPLVKQLELWHEWLLKVFIHREKQYGPAGLFIRNAAGKRKYLSELFKDKSRWHAKAQLTAFLLQGVEACTMHHLTVMGEKYGYKPVGNEHDGLITIGQIPPEAVAEASALSGFRNARLEIKDFV